MTVSVFEPSAFELLGGSRPPIRSRRATSTITEPTPIMMPSVVRPERILLATMPRSAIVMLERFTDGALDAAATARHPDWRTSSMTDAVAQSDDAARPVRATSCSCVITITVRPSRCSPSNRSSTSAVDSLSSAPVGSSARMIAGVGDDRARDRDALLLTAGELVRRVIQAIAEPDRLERARRALSPLGLRHAGVHHRELDVGERRGARDEVEALEHEADLAVAHDRRAR